MDISSWYVPRHANQLSLLPSVGREMSVGQETVFSRREGNRRSGFAPAMRHRRAQRPKEWEEHLVYTPLRSAVPFTFIFFISLCHLFIFIRSFPWFRQAISKSHGITASVNAAVFSSKTEFSSFDFNSNLPKQNSHLTFHTFQAVREGLRPSCWPSLTYKYCQNHLQK